MWSLGGRNDHWQRWTPLRLLGAVLGITGLAEAGVMLVLPALLSRDTPAWVEALADAALLTVAVAPLLWWIIVRPLRGLAAGEHARAAAIVHATGDAIISADSSGWIVGWNRGAQAIFGHGESEVIGKPVTVLMPQRYRDAHDQGLARLRAGAPPRVLGRTMEVYGLRKDGSEFPVELSLTRWAAIDGTFYGAVVRDISERKRLDQMKADFVSFVTHQLRTPLAGIKWLLELAAQDPGVGDETSSYIQDSRASAERLIRLVNDLLDASRLESGKLVVAPADTHLGEITQSVLGELAPLIGEKGHRISVAGADGVPTVVVDPQLLRQVVLNLVANAIKYTPPGGRIVIRMGHADSALRWEIQDNGVGIRAEDQPRLFEKFFRAENILTLEPEGTGLGLYLVRLIVTRFGGSVSCKSTEGQGTTFFLSLPLTGES